MKRFCLTHVADQSDYSLPRDPPTAGNRAYLKLWRLPAFSPKQLSTQLGYYFYQCEKSEPDKEWEDGDLQDQMAAEHLGLCTYNTSFPGQYYIFFLENVSISPFWPQFQAWAAAPTPPRRIAGPPCKALQKGAGSARISVIFLLFNVSN